MRLQMARSFKPETRTCVCGRLFSNNMSYMSHTQHCSVWGNHISSVLGSSDTPLLIKDFGYVAAARKLKVPVRVLQENFSIKHQYRKRSNWWKRGKP